LLQAVQPLHKTVFHYCMLFEQGNVLFICINKILQSWHT